MTEGSAKLEDPVNERAALVGRARAAPCLASPVLLPSQVAQGLPAAAEVATARLRCSPVSAQLVVGPLVGAGHPA